MHKVEEALEEAVGELPARPTIHCRTQTTIFWAFSKVFSIKTKSGHIHDSLCRIATCANFSIENNCPSSRCFLWPLRHTKKRELDGLKRKVDRMSQMFESEQHSSAHQSSVAVAAAAAAAPHHQHLQHLGGSARGGGGVMGYGHQYQHQPQPQHVTRSASRRGGAN